MNILSPYPSYRDSGLPWLGQIPAHWDIERIKFNSYVKGRIGWQNLRSEEFTTEGPYLITGMHFKDGGIDWDSCFHITGERYQMAPEIQVKDGDLLITKDGSIGKLAYIDKLPGKASLNSHLLVIRPLKNRYETKFLFYLLDSSLFKHYILETQTGTTFFGITQESVVSFPLVLPPLPEQRMIAAFLDRHTAKIDALVAKKQRLLELLAEKRSALISQAVTKGLPSPRGRGAGGEVRLKDSGVAWLGQVPEHWEVVHLRRVIEKFIDYRGHTPQKVDDGIPLITARNIKNGKIDWELSREYIPSELYIEWMVRGFPETGDVLVTTEAPLGETAQIADTHIALAQRIILLKVDKTRITNDYLKYFLASSAGQGELWSRATGSTAIGIKASHLKEIFIIVPPIEEQIAITNLIDRESGKIFPLIAKVETAIERLWEYRSALISSAVMGKICLQDEGGG
jgi:type I restriction enzyme, S subunit